METTVSFRVKWWVSPVLKYVCDPLAFIGLHRLAHHVCSYALAKGLTILKDDKHV